MLKLQNSPQSQFAQSPQPALSNLFATPPERPIPDFSNFNRQIFIQSAPSRENAEVEPFDTDYKVPPLVLNDKSESEDDLSSYDCGMSETEVSPKNNCNKKRLKPSGSDDTLSKHEMVLKVIKRLKI